MCGISGIINFNNSVDKQALWRFNNSLIHRGPDYQDIYISPAKTVGLGHCRLSIVDTSANANQPFMAENGNFVLTFNGEIYNFIEIRRELSVLGYQFKTNSDTEVLIKAYQQWQEKCLTRFNGMWAFAIWDETKQRLFLSRDRFGVKSLYYRQDGKMFSFASEQKAFKEHPFGLNVSANNASYLMLYPEAIESERTTLYENVYKLLPGEYMYVSHQALEITRWWNTYEEISRDCDKQPLNHEELSSLFIDACELRTRTDVNIATALSGGLDSSAVTSALATIPGLKTSKHLKSFIGSFQNSQLDEFKWAKLVVDHHNLDYRRVVIDGKDALNHITESCLALEDVTTLPAIGQWLVYKAMKEEGYKVSIEGHAGDELLGGYQRHVNVYLGDILRRRNDPQCLAELLCMLGEMDNGTHAGFISGNLLQAPLDSDYIHTKLNNKKLYLTTILKEQGKAPKSPVSELSLPGYANESMLFRKLYEDFHYYSLPNILKNYDRLSMANSVEIRSPFLDYRFVSSAFKASEKYKIANGANKALIRNHFNFIPSPVRERKDKSGFTPPMHNWLKENLMSWLEELMSDSIITESTLFDGRQLAKTVQHLTNTQQTEKVLLYWPLINLAVIDRSNREFN